MSLEFKGNNSEHLDSKVDTKAEFTQVEGGGAVVGGTEVFETRYAGQSTTP